MNFNICAQCAHPFSPSGIWKRPDFDKTTRWVVGCSVCKTGYEITRIEICSSPLSPEELAKVRNVNR